MSRHFRKRIWVFTIIFTLIFNTSDVASATAPKTNCNIRVDDAHISTYLQRNLNIRAVKVNAGSKCNLPMWDLVLRVEIYKEGLLRDYKVADYDKKIKGFIAPNRVIKNWSTYAECNSHRRSKYYGKAQAIATINGKRMQTRQVVSQNIKNLACGT